MRPNINSYRYYNPMIYAYSTPGVKENEGWLKIGEARSQTVQERVGQQGHSAGIKNKIEWYDNAIYTDRSGRNFLYDEEKRCFKTFRDHDFHRYLEKHGIERKVFSDSGKKSELFKISAEKAKEMFSAFVRHDNSATGAGEQYTLRSEQDECVTDTWEYFENGGKEYLWNAKPRFGKCLSTYELIQAMGCEHALILTNRPAISDSWLSDFNKFIAHKNEYRFVSENEAMRNAGGAMTMAEYDAESLNYPTPEDAPGIIAFESLQSLKGSKYFGGAYDKLKWISDFDWDLVILDESHEAIDTRKTQKALSKIDRKHTLYLSGTPFRQLATGQFTNENIYNWTYADEQQAKADSGDDDGAYSDMPTMNLFTYQMSNIVEEKVGAKLRLDDESEVDYAFDLNEFFSTDDKGRFRYEDAVRKFIRALYTQEKYPFSTEELRSELRHTLWHLDRVASAKALKKLLDNDPVFGKYETVLAAGDGIIDDEEDDETADRESGSALARVKKAIAENDRTITLTVGQLTVGVTVREWSGVMMLCNMKSPAAYIQAAFRCQNPDKYTSEDGQMVRKENCYVFDFDPARTLEIYSRFATELTPPEEKEGKEEEIKRLLNFFPVYGEEDNGEMVMLDAKQILSIPARIKCIEVVRRGFMSNFLFSNINNIFSAPQAVKEIISKMKPAHEEPKNRKRDAGLDDIDSVKVDEDGNAIVNEETVIGKHKELFGDKLYEIISEDLKKLDGIVGSINEANFSTYTKDAIKQTYDDLIKNVYTPAFEKEENKPSKSVKNRLEKQLSNEIANRFTEAAEELGDKLKAEKELHERALENASTTEERRQLEKEHEEKKSELIAGFTEKLRQESETLHKEKSKELPLTLEKDKQERKKKGVEDTVRDNLRGFTRSIPSFIMAYGDKNLTLDNFDRYVEADVFAEVTGITMDEFLFLRDGGDYSGKNGETEHFNGHLFNERVFDDSIIEFLNKKSELGDYFNEEHTEDIFDYIPPQKTNQIFTPRKVVRMMVDQLEANNPGCFDDPENTFADLYMKSGLYITEIIKRLYRSERMKQLYPDDDRRLEHILTKQVYGMAPTKIIYRIALSYILGFEGGEKYTANFALEDAAEAAKNGTLQQAVDKHFGRR